ncbi:MAG: ATP-binding protein [Pirellulaceae bacterium]
MHESWKSSLLDAARHHAPEIGFRQLAHDLAVQIDATHSCVSIRDHESEFVRLIVLDTPTVRMDSGVYFFESESLVAKLAADSAPFTWEGEPTSELREAQFLRCKHLMVLPLVLSGRVLGALVFGKEEENFDFDIQHDLQLASSIAASILSEHLTNARRESESKTNKRYKHLVLAVESLGRQPTLFDIALFASQSIEKLLGCEKARVLIKQEGQFIELNGGKNTAAVWPSIPATWSDGQDKFDELPLSESAKTETKLYPLVQGRELVGAVQIKAPKQVVRESTSRLILNLFLSAMATTIKKQTNFEDAVDMGEAAETANASKTQFLSNISHEVRTPLSSIVGLASLMREQASGINEEYVDTILRSADVLKSVIHDLLDLSKMESGHLELTPAPVNVRKLINQCHEMVRVSASQKGLNLRLSISDAMPECILVDETRLTQILLNLLSNAIKFTPAGSIGLEASYLPSTGMSKFVVRDSGPGIADENLEQIFKPFFQAPETALEAAGGTGLGLSICKQLCQSMGGNIVAGNTQQLGAEFTVRLPLASVQQEAHSRPASPEQETSQNALDKRILFVDDNELNRNTAKALLKRLGGDVSFACCGTEAVKTAAQIHPHIILMDINMPDMDGIEASKCIRELNLQPEPYIVAVSGYVQEEYRQKAAQGGLNSFLEKPYSIAELRNELTNGEKFLRSQAPDTSSAHGERTPRTSSSRAT